MAKNDTVTLILEVPELDGTVGYQVVVVHQVSDTFFENSRTAAKKRARELKKEFKLPANRFIAKLRDIRDEF